ncbi:hypothetical protein ACG7TL_004395 [Trametes sanguinea]
MAYQYYQTSLPGWGTSQFQFGTPWAPSFQPQPSWGGLDFYNAHAVSPDPSLYNSVMARAPEFGAMGIGHRHARHWHRLLYSGLTSLTQALPNDIGAAAAYEMYRAWKHNSFLYEPLSADRTQQREGLIGMAIAEATRLWQYSGRPMDTYGQRAACEAAAAVASVLADRLISYIGGYGGGLRAGGSPYMSGGALPYANSPIGGSPAMMGTPLASGSHYLGSSPGTLSAMASPDHGAGILIDTGDITTITTITVAAPAALTSYVRVRDMVRMVPEGTKACPTVAGTAGMMGTAVGTMGTAVHTAGMLVAVTLAVTGDTEDMGDIEAHWEV